MDMDVNNTKGVAGMFQLAETLRDECPTSPVSFYNDRYLVSMSVFLNVVTTKNKRYLPRKKGN